MCGRYALYGPQSRYREHFHVDAWPDFPDRYNLVPSLELPILRQDPDGKRVVHLLKWGLVPHWAKDPAIGAKLNNARAETVAEKPSFRTAYQRRRCLVPASGFYEWQAIAGTGKQPWYIQLKSGEPMAMGGLWESWTSPDGEILRTFCVITTGPNEIMAPIHDRMPVLIAPVNWTAWLSAPAENVSPLLAPYPAESMEAWRVSRWVNKTSSDDPALIEPESTWPTPAVDLHCD